MTHTFACLNQIGRRAFVLCAAACLPTAAAFGVPALRLSPASGPPTTRITVSGKGFPAGSGIDLFFDTGDRALAIANSKGAFSVAVRIPTAAQPGAHWVTALIRASQTGVQKPFVVETNWVEHGFTPEGKRSNPTRIL